MSKNIKQADTILSDLNSKLSDHEKEELLSEDAVKLSNDFNNLRNTLKSFKTNSDATRAIEESLIGAIQRAEDDLELYGQDTVDEQDIASTLNASRIDLECKKLLHQKLTSSSSVKELRTILSIERSKITQLKLIEQTRDPHEGPKSPEVYNRTTTPTVLPAIQNTQEQLKKGRRTGGSNIFSTQQSSFTSLPRIEEKKGATTSNTHQQSSFTHLPKIEEQKIDTQEQPKKGRRTGSSNIFSTQQSSFTHLPKIEEQKIDTQEQPKKGRRTGGSNIFSTQQSSFTSLPRIEEKKGATTSNTHQQSSFTHLPKLTAKKEVASEIETSTTASNTHQQSSFTSLPRIEEKKSAATSSTQQSSFTPLPKLKAKKEVARNRKTGLLDTPFERINEEEISLPQVLAEQALLHERGNSSTNRSSSSVASSARGDRAPLPQIPTNKQTSSSTNKSSSSVASTISARGDRTPLPQIPTEQTSLHERDSNSTKDSLTPSTEVRTKDYNDHITNKPPFQHLL